MTRVRVAVVGGGASCEHEVSLATARSVSAALDPTAYDVVRLTIGRDGRWLDHGGVEVGLAAAVSVLAGVDVVFPAVHGPHGEDGTLAALCDLVGVPHVGSGVRAGALAMDKWATKLVAAELGIASAAAVLVSSPWNGTPPRVSLPVVVKPVAAGSSFGVSRVDHAADLEVAVKAALDLDDRVLVEELLVGREIDVAVLGHPDGGRVVAPALEVVVGGGALFDTARKYDGTADFRLPADLTDAERDQLGTAAVAVFDAVGCAGVARVDFFLTADGLRLNEVNTMPGLTEQSQVPKMFAAGGTSYPRLLRMLVDEALVRGPAR